MGKRFISAAIEVSHQEALQIPIQYLPETQPQIFTFNMIPILVGQLIIEAKTL